MNYINIKNKQILLTDEQAEAIIAAIREMESLKPKKSMLSEIPAGETIHIGGHEFIVLEQSGNTTALIRKDLLPTSEKFGKNNNYDGSYVDALCNKFGEEIASVVGEKNLVLHTVDLTSDDGMKDYGKVRRRVSLLTTDLYRRYVDILDKYNPKKYWWLATAFSTKKHDGDSWVKCVSPSGCLGNGHYGYYGDFGVRPFCILKSDIFVSR